MDACGVDIIPQKRVFAYNNFVIIVDQKLSHFFGGEIQMKRMFGFLIGIFVGALVGSTIALLIAPESGEKLRNQLRERGQNFMNDIQHAAESRKIELHSRVESLRAPREF